MILLRCFLLGCFFSQIVACHTPPNASLTIYQIRSFKDTADEIYLKLIKEYRQRWVQMDQIIAYSPSKYWQRAKTPLPVISNWVADAILYSAGKMIGREPHLVLVPVGTTFQQLPRGNISYRDIFRLFPGHYRWEFRQLPLDVVEQLFDTTISAKSWGISAGTSIMRNEQKKIQVICRQAEANPFSKINVILVRDSWEDNKLLPFLHDHPAIMQGNHLFDFIIAYCQSFTAAGIPLRISTEKRIHAYD